VQLDKKVAIITGAKGGLGSFVTEAFLKAGATVIGVSRSIQASDFSGRGFVAMPSELSSGLAARALTEVVVSRFQKIDVLVHLIGAFAGGKAVGETDDATLERMLDANFRSAFYIARAAVPHMRSQGSGRILAIGSRTAVEPQPMIAAYNASKAALVSLIRTLALENKDRGITANIVLPGMMDTAPNRAAAPTADFSKWVHPSQVAALLVHLASDEASEITGAAIPVYGQEL
jgi:NAD(P)-dependent dehydrogenase (short-subunit alcohol dehydrogenase family)